jgi:hypothetical protein
LDGYRESHGDLGELDSTILKEVAPILSKIVELIHPNRTILPLRFTLRYSYAEVIAQIAESLKNFVLLRDVAVLSKFHSPGTPMKKGDGILPSPFLI